jgi:hypothetical protein
MITIGGNPARQRFSSEGRLLARLRSSRPRPSTSASIVPSGTNSAVASPASGWNPIPRSHPAAFASGASAISAATGVCRETA